MKQRVFLVTSGTLFTYHWTHARGVLQESLIPQRKQVCKISKVSWTVSTTPKNKETFNTSLLSTVWQDNRSVKEIQLSFKPSAQRNT